MFIDQTRLRIAAPILSFLALVSLSYGLHSKFGYVSACRARVANLELVAAKNTRNEAALDAMEKALDATEAHLNSIKQ
jgi:hypothetical protein